MIADLKLPGHIQTIFQERIQIKKMGEKTLVKAVYLILGTVLIVIPWTNVIIITIPLRKLRSDLTIQDKQNCVQFPG